MFDQTQFHVGTIGSSGRPVVFHLASNMWFEFDPEGRMGFHNNPTWSGDRDALFAAAREFAERHGAIPKRADEFEVDVIERKVLHGQSGIWFGIGHFGEISFHDVPAWRGDRLELAGRAKAFAVARGLRFSDSAD